MIRFIKLLLFSFTLILFQFSIYADLKSSISEFQGVLKWGADLRNGVPYVFFSPEDSVKLAGPENEIVEAICKEIKMAPQFLQQDWEVLIPSLQQGKIDVAINGLAITPEREKVVAFSRPYFVTYAQLVVHESNNSIATLEDCYGLKVGTLLYADATKVLERHPSITALYYAHENNLFTDLKNGRIDAILVDYPVALYYSQLGKGTKLVGESIGRIEYGIGINKKNKKLLDKVNAAIGILIENGTLRKIYDNWNIWNPLAAKAFGDYSPRTQPPTAYENYFKFYTGTKNWKDTFSKYLTFIPILCKGAIMTLQISFLAMLVAIALGFILALMRIYGSRPVSIFSKVYIEVFRGTPILIQLYLICYGLPAIGIKFNPFVAGVITLGLNYAAFEAENYRSGILAIPRSQMEAARALGMTHIEGLWHVVIPQAFRIMLPPVTNDFISLLKDSSLVSLVAIADLTFAYNILSSSYYNYFEMGIIVSIIYLLLGVPFVLLARWAELRLAVERKRKIVRVTKN